MPFVIVDFGAIAVALLATLLAVALYVLLRALASAIGSIGIGPFSLHLGNIIAGALNDAANWIVDQTKHLWGDIEALFRATAYIFDRLFNATVGAISHAFDYLDHIATVQIPAAIGGLRKDVEGYADAAIKGVEGDISTAVHKVESILSGDVAAIYSTIRTDVDQPGDTIVKSVAAGVVTSEHFASDGLHDLRNYVDNAVAAAVAGLEADLATAKQQIGTAIAGVAQTAANDLANAEGVLAGEITSVASTAASEFASAEQAATTEITSLAGTVATEISTAVGTLTGDIASETQAFTGDLTSLRALLEAAIASSVGALAVRVAKLEECSVGTCADSPNNFSSLLNAALGGISIALLADFLKNAIQHPADAQAGFVGEVSGLFQSGTSLFDQVLNL